MINVAKLIDFIDLRIYSIIITIGLIITCISIYILPFNIFYLVIIILSLRFFGQGAMTHAGITSLTRYFGKDRGKAISFGNLGGMFGVMFLPIIVVYFKNFFSFREIWLFSSLSLIIFLPILYITLNNQKQRQKSLKSQSKVVLRNGKRLM